MPSVLFVCTANQYRSPIAAAAFKEMLRRERWQGTWEIASAGTWTTPGVDVLPSAEKLARDRGLSLKGHRTSLISQIPLARFDLILVMEAGHKEALASEFAAAAPRVFMLSEIADGIRYDVPDPASSFQHADEYVRKLYELIERGFPQIIKLATLLRDSRTDRERLEIGRSAGDSPNASINPDPAGMAHSRNAAESSNEITRPHARKSNLRALSGASPAARRSRAAKRSIRFGLLFHNLMPYLLSALLLSGWLGFRLWQVAELGARVRSDVGQLNRLVQARPGGAQLPQVGAALSTLQQDLRSFETGAGPLLWMGPMLRWVPVYGADLGSSRDLVDVADGLLASANQAYQILRPRAGKAPDPLQLINQLNSSHSDVLDARASFDKARLARQRIDPQQLSPELRRLIVEEIDPLMAWMDDGLSLAASLPYLAGANDTGPRTYLLLVQNEDELRPSGGFITAVGTLVVEDGKISNLSFEDSGQMDDWSKPFPLAPWQLEQYMNSPVLVFRDSNWFVDFPTSAEYATYLYMLGQPKPVTVDGVIAFNQSVLVSLLQVLGPIQVNGVPYLITADNVQEYMRDAKTPAPGDPREDWSRKAFIPKVAQSIIDKVISGNADWSNLSAMFLRLLNERRILVQLNDARAAQVLARRAWDGAVEPDSGDYLYVVDSNIGFNKTNAVVSEELFYDVDLSDPAHPIGQLSVNQFNHAAAGVPCIQWNQGQIAGEASYPIDRCYWDYMRVYQNSQAVLVDSTPHAVQEDWMILEQAVEPKVDILDDEIRGVQGYGTLLVLPGGQNLTTAFKFALPASVLSRLPGSDASTYTLRIQKQAGTLAIPVTVRVHLPRNASLLSAPAEALVQDNNVMVQGNLDTDLYVEIQVRLR